jgi:hypothetical protein
VLSFVNLRDGVDVAGMKAPDNYLRFFRSISFVSEIISYTFAEQQDNHDTMSEVELYLIDGTVNISETTIETDNIFEL